MSDLPQVGLYEQKLADLQQELKRLAHIIDKGVPTEPENLLTWQQTYRQYIEVKKRIKTLLDQQQALSELL